MWQSQIHTALSLVTAPTLEPVTVDEFKAHARIDLGDDDTLANSYLKAARRWCETYTRRQFINATWRQSFDNWPCILEPHIAQLVSVSSITYVDTAGTTQTWSSSNYNVDTYSLPGRIELAYNATFPAIREQVNAINMTFVAGYGTSPANVPDTIKTAIKMLAAHWYQNREPIVVGMTANKIGFALEALLGSERWGSYA